MGGQLRDRLRVQMALGIYACLAATAVWLAPIAQAAKQQSKSQAPCLALKLSPLEFAARHGPRPEGEAAMSNAQLLDHAVRLGVHSHPDVQRALEFHRTAADILESSQTRLGSLMRTGAGDSVVTKAQEDLSLARLQAEQGVYYFKRQVAKIAGLPESEIEALSHLDALQSRRIQNLIPLSLRQRELRRIRAKIGELEPQLRAHDSGLRLSRALTEALEEKGDHLRALESSDRAGEEIKDKLRELLPLHESKLARIRREAENGVRTAIADPLLRKHSRQLVDAFLSVWPDFRSPLEDLAVRELGRGLTSKESRRLALAHFTGNKDSAIKAFPGLDRSVMARVLESASGSWRASSGVVGLRKAAYRLFPAGIASRLEESLAGLSAGQRDKVVDWILRSPSHSHFLEQARRSQDEALKRWLRASQLVEADFGTASQRGGYRMGHSLGELFEMLGTGARQEYETARKEFRIWSANFRNFRKRPPLLRKHGASMPEDRVIAAVHAALGDPARIFDHLMSFEFETRLHMRRYLVPRSEAQEAVLRAMEKRQGFAPTVRDLDGFATPEDWAAMLKSKEIFRDRFFGSGTSHGINNHRIQFYALGREIEANPERFKVGGRTLSASDIYALMADSRNFERSFDTGPRTLWQETFDIFLENNFASPGYWTRVREQFGLSEWD